MPPEYLRFVSSATGKSDSCPTMRGESRALQCSFANKFVQFRTRDAGQPRRSLRTRRLWPFALATKVLHLGHALVSVLRFPCKLF